MRKDEFLKKIERYKERSIQCQMKLETIRRSVVSLNVPLFPEQLDKYCTETDFIFKKLDEEMVILDYLIKSYKDYVSKEGF